MGAMRKACRRRRARADREPARHRACAGESAGRGAGGGAGGGGRAGNPASTAARSCAASSTRSSPSPVIEVAATLLLLPWAWGDFSLAHGDLAVFMTTKLVGFAASAGLLLWAGRGDWRTWLLGVYCLLKATNQPLYMLQAFFLELPPPPEYAAFLQHLPADSRVFLRPLRSRVPVRAGLPVGVCPRVPAGTSPDLAR